MQVEFQEIYGELYDLKYKDIESGKVKKTKKRLAELNDCLRQSITNAKAVTEALMKYEEKFDYLQSIINMLLGMANRYGKFIETDYDKAIENSKLSLETYSQARKFVDDFKAFKKYDSDA